MIGCNIRQQNHCITDYGCISNNCKWLVSPCLSEAQREIIHPSEVTEEAIKDAMEKALYGETKGLGYVGILG